MKNSSELIYPVLLCLGAASWSGCAGTSSTSNAATATTCSLPSDQSGTLTARWQTAPIPISLHNGDFTSAEVAQIAAAVATWNTFFGASTQISILDNGGTNFRTSAATVPNSALLCSMTDVQGSAFIQPVVIYKDTTWPYSSQSQAMALTTYCRNSASPGASGATARESTGAHANSAASTIQAQLSTFRMAMTEVNYQAFFTTQQVPDLQTIMLHEFGHLIGLNHSCDNSTPAGFPTCSGTGANPDYQAAVMYPVFGFDSTGAGQQRRSLTTNDESRANCLYQQ